MSSQYYGFAVQLLGGGVWAHQALSWCQARGTAEPMCSFCYACKHEDGQICCWRKFGKGLCNLTLATRYVHSNHELDSACWRARPHAQNNWCNISRPSVGPIWLKILSYAAKQQLEERLYTFVCVLVSRILSRSMASRSMASRAGLLGVSHRGERLAGNANNRPVPSMQAIGANTSQSHAGDASDSAMLPSLL